MKNSIITEFVKITVPETTTMEQLTAKADRLNDFLKIQDGFIDAELVKYTEGNTWCFIYHYENLEKVKAIGEKLRNSKLFDEITPLIVPGSVNVTFCRRLKNW